jgi:hypothetical protein
LKYDPYLYGSDITFPDTGILLQNDNVIVYKKGTPIYISQVPHGDEDKYPL